ncbi:MAG: methyltransferase domain-containing protein, partial [Acidimicrobiales bacterium]
VTTGRLVAVDHSATMLRQCGARNRDLLKGGRLTLIGGRAESLADVLGPFDRIYAMNVWQFWSDQEAVIASLARLLGPGGRLAIGYQPRHRGATAADGDVGRRCLRDQFAEAGLIDIIDRTFELQPPANYVIGTRPQGRPARELSSRGTVLSGTVGPGPVLSGTVRPGPVLSGTVRPAGLDATVGP